MLFDSIDIHWSPNINIISGANSTGKTALIKLMYSTLKVLGDTGKSKAEPTKDKFCEDFARKLQGVFRPDEDTIGRLVNRKPVSNRQPGSYRTDIHFAFQGADDLSFGFSSRQKKRIELQNIELPIKKTIEAVYIPPKEIISAVSNFASLYDEFKIDFEETYYDLARLLDRPLRKGANTHEQNAVLDSFGQIMKGNIVFRDKKFFLKVKGSGEFEMGLVSEGYRKLSTLMYLILTNSLSKGSVLFWDEPETNMNPKMIAPIAQALMELANMGVQIFVTTHDYFVQQCFNLLADYPNPNGKKLNYNFISLYEDDGRILYESAESLRMLTHNAVMEEFDALYDRELRLLDGTK